MKKAYIRHAIFIRHNLLNSLENTNPSLAKEWHPTKNGDLNPSMFKSGSRKKVWWVCKKGHDFESTINYRNKTNGKGCPYCANQKIGYGNDLKSKNPSLAKEWNYKKNKKLKPTDVVPGSGKKVWWVCKKGHEWDEPIRNRVNHKTGCVYCSNRRLGYGNDLETKYPDIAKEWHPNKNGNLSPKTEVYGAGKYVWWKCIKGHEWRTTIVHRTRLKTGCPKCFPFFSKIELQFFSELKYLFPSTISSYKIKKIEIDIYIQELNLGIEYDGSFFHSKQDKQKRDENKNFKLKELGIDLIRVREKPLEKISINDVLIGREAFYDNIVKLLKELIKIRPTTKQKISKYIDEGQIKNNKYFNQLLKKFPNPVHPLSETHPSISKMWNYKRNDNTTPNQFSYGSIKRVWWICQKGHEWEAKILNICNSTSKGCPYCANLKVGYGNDLQSKNSSLAKEWNYKKNKKLKPTDIISGSTKKVWWVCKKGHEWEATPRYRNRSRVCPICKKLPNPIPMMTSKQSVLEFINQKSIFMNKLPSILGYNVSPNTIKAWLIGKYNSPENFEKICRDKKDKMIKYSKRV